MKKFCVCFSSDMNYVKHLCVALESLCQNSAYANFDVVIFENNIDKQTKKLILLKFKFLNIVFFQPLCCLNKINVVTKNHINKSAYLRYFIIDILNNYEKVLYLDCDLIINTDINKIFDIDICGYCVGAVRDTFHCYCNSPKHPAHLKENKYVKESLKLNNVFNYFNSGVILFNIKELKKQNYTTELLFKITEEKQFKWMDQDALNYIFKNKTKFIDQKWNCMVGDYFKDLRKSIYNIIPEPILSEYIEAYEHPYIIHYAGAQQPIYNKDAAYSDLYWTYAKESIFYQDLLKESADNAKKRNCLKKFLKKHRVLYRIALFIRCIFKKD